MVTAAATGTGDAEGADSKESEEVGTKEPAMDDMIEAPPEGSWVDAEERWVRM